MNPKRRVHGVMSHVSVMCTLQGVGLAEDYRTKAQWKMMQHS